jgi:hypothetical protein
VPLVLVNGDTVTTDELLIEIDLMEKMNPQADESTTPDADHVLRRLIQNRLILQEGYRMGMDRESSVTNQVKELTRKKSMVMLLDSVAMSVPEDTPELLEVRRAAVRDYIDGLISRYSVNVDSTVLRSLDYGSADEAVQEQLRTSDKVLAVVPTGTLTVARFTRNLRFQEFHGLVGKPDAAERRDKALNEWVTEAVLTYQARAQKLQELPSVAGAARDLERFLVRQETIQSLLDSPYEPDAGEIQKYYQENIASFMSPTRVKMRSKKLNTEEAAEAFRDKLLKGADIEWLGQHDPQVVEGKDPFPYEFFAPEKLGLKPEEAVAGHIPEPFGVPGGWVVAVVSEVEDPVPMPLSDCRSTIVAQLKGRHRQEMMTSVIARLEDASTIEILPGAQDAVQRVLEAR